MGIEGSTQIESLVKLVEMGEESYQQNHTSVSQETSIPAYSDSLNHSYPAEIEAAARDAVLREQVRIFLFWVQFFFAV